MTARRTHEDEVAAVTFEHDDESVVVIVGSGAGGGTLANELAQKGVNVVLIEAGPRFQMTEFVNDEYGAYDLFTWKDKRIATGTSPVAEKFREAPTWIVKAVGGTSVHWAGQAVRFQPHEFRARSTYGDIPGASLIDWPLSYEEMAPYYDRAEYKLGVSGTHGTPEMPHSNLYRVFAHSARRAGYKQVSQCPVAVLTVPRDGRNACDQIGFCMQGCKSGAKWSSLYAEIPAGEATGRLEVRAECMALQIRHDDRGRVTGVLYVDKAGRRHLQKARVVCVAGNSIETPRLLLNSASAKYPDGLANSSGHVGRNYLRNMFAFAYGIFDRPVTMHRGYVAPGLVRDEAGHDPKRGFAGGIYFTAVGLGLPYHAAFLDPGAWGREFASAIEGYANTCGVVVLGEDLPVPSSSVTLHPSEKDGYGLPIPVLNLDVHANEFPMRNYGLKKAAELLEAGGAKRVIECPPMPSTHNLGTCRMSAEPADGVCNRWGQTHDIPNLFISDGSQFSSNNAGNPTLTIATLAVRQAAYLADQLRTNSL
ncbi:MAG: GMC family oxidoreductase [Alphaproteobacteria bacterium]|nr:GMC family oxidoreductase [Alphaproteobacteria bacterium]